MTVRTQLIVSVGIIGAAAGAVAIYSLVATPRVPAAADAHAAHGAGPATSATGRPVLLDAEGARRIGVTYATAEHRVLTHEVRTVANVTYDETRLVDVDPKVEGWVERLHVDFTGAPVVRGQPLLDLYSPMLLSAQEELLLARRLVEEAAAGGSERAARTAQDLLESARRRLRYWDIPDAQIARIEASGEPQRTITLVAPASGVVVEKNVIAGSRIMPGMKLFRIADLSRVWLEIDVFEKDLSLVRLSQHGVVLFEAYPGEEFDGLVTYVYPTVAPDARTGRVRLELANPARRLKPGMSATVLLHLAEPREALVVPRTAVLQTGQRALVFVRDFEGVLVPRTVTVGLAVGNDVEITAGVQPGEVVVTSANFLIDAESNLGASLGAWPTTELQASPEASAAAGHAGH